MHPQIFFALATPLSLPSTAAQRQAAFLPSVHSRRRRSITTELRNARPVQMAVVPDDTALDMISFALSGPGVFASVAFLGGLGGLLFTFGEIGPRRSAATEAPVVLLRVSIGAPLQIELATGGTRKLRQGETVLRFPSREACKAAARQLEAAAQCKGCTLEYVMYRAGQMGISELTRFPLEVNAPGAQWESVDVFDDVSDKERALLEYDRTGAASDIDREWAQVVDALSPIRFEKRAGDCKLCAGLGKVRCSRCGGASKAGGNFVCHCHDGRVDCDWCKGSGSAQ